MNVKELTDEQLTAWIDRAYDDCQHEVEQEKESEAHVEAFAGLMMLIFEARERGLHLKRMH